MFETVSYTGIKTVCMEGLSELDCFFFWFITDLERQQGWSKPICPRQYHQMHGIQHWLITGY